MYQTERTPRIRQWEVPLITAETRLRITTTPRGRRAVVTFEFAPAAFTGNTPGIEIQLTMRAKDTVLFGKTLAYIKAEMEQGRGVVPGQNYGRHKLNLSGAGESGGIVFLFLAPNDCETIISAIADAVAYATTNPGLY